MQLAALVNTVTTGAIAALQAAVTAIQANYVTTNTVQTLTSGKTLRSLLTIDSSINGLLALTPRTINATGTHEACPQMEIDSSAANVTVTLAATSQARFCAVVRTDNTANTCTVQLPVGETFRDGSTSILLGFSQAAILLRNGAVSGAGVWTIYSMHP